MIRFKCIYCGQRILAPDNGVGKKGKCPKCNHLLTVPASTKGRPAISPDAEPMPVRPKSVVIEKGKKPRYTTEEIQEESAKLFKESFGFLVPTYDKLSVLLMAVTLILLYSTNVEMRNWIRRDWAKEWIKARETESITVKVISFTVPAFITAFFSHIAVKRKKLVLKKMIMLIFAVLTNAYTGIISGWHIIKNNIVGDWLLIFPLWNIINGFMLLAMLRFNIIDEDCIVDRKMTFARILTGIAAVVVIFYICNYVFKMYWAITFSICIVWTTSFDRALQSVFPGLIHREPIEEENKNIE